MAPSLSKNKISFIKYTPFFLCKNIYVLCSNKRIESKINSCTKLACQQSCTMTSNNTNNTKNGEASFWSRSSFPKTKKILLFAGCKEKKKFMNKSGGKNAFQGDPGHISYMPPRLQWGEGRWWQMGGGRTIFIIIYLGKIFTSCNNYSCYLFYFFLYIFCYFVLLYPIISVKYKNKYMLIKIIYKIQNK